MKCFVGREEESLHEARRVSPGAPRGVGSTEGRWKRGGFTEKARSGKHGGRIGKMHSFIQWKMHSFILYFYASMRRGRLIFIFFFLVGSLKVS